MVGRRVPRVELNPCRKPRLSHGFRVRNRVAPGEPIRKAAREYVADVQAGRFPGAGESFR